MQEGDVGTRSGYRGSETGQEVEGDLQSQWGDQGPGRAEPPGQMEQREWRVLLEFRIGLVATCPSCPE